MPKHIPQRTCVACRETKPKRELVRVVRVSDDRVEVDRTGKQNGRGAYFCPAQECWELGQKRKALNHALSMVVSPENWADLLEYARERLPEKKVPTRVPATVGSPGGPRKKT
ncbi:MAG: YlxR family protein [Chloroflexi bacterium]|nr:YlxR family protein [Chloroflexota bacterium]